ncbi:dr1-associated corepressor-like protein [Cinnamomum micranthum f. kanehirae]|uniref:Dr1-associated corepressor-like protein n=1 Tax=Cinnamomum micranthum f. kanehirae TaxID=337451 RepID=A0A443NXZ0_9MAGN|nr:dr1-associated corepressor-like protein [Cinnamomum micranthum f. kanehirae]
MRKKLDTRFPAARIKKIMQADEDVGKIAMAVPLLVSKALELFLQDLCDRTYDITLQRGAKTMSSLHLKQCVRSFNVFDFLREIVSKVPDMGGSDAAGEDRSITRRRKAVDDEDIDTDEESKRPRIVRSLDTIMLNHEAGHAGSGRGRGRVRGRGRGRPRRAVERESTFIEKCEDDPDISPERNGKQSKQNAEVERLDNSIEAKELKENIVSSSANAIIQKIDLNVVLDENGDTSAAVTSIPQPESKYEEYPGWSLSDTVKMAIDPIQLAQFNGEIDEEEDYDEEG